MSDEGECLRRIMLPSSTDLAMIISSTPHGKVKGERVRGRRQGTVMQVTPTSKQIVGPLYLFVEVK